MNMVSEPTAANSRAASKLFTPLPLRARGTLELFDTAIKVYKSYVSFLLLWTGGAFALLFVLFYFAIDEYLNLAPEEWIAFLLSVWVLAPFVVSGGIGCVLAALKGRPARFIDSWRFARPQFWTMWRTVLMAGFIIVMLSIAGTLLAAIGVENIGPVVSPLFDLMPNWLSVILGFLLSILLIAAYIFVHGVAGMWAVMALAVVSLERKSSAIKSLNRSSALLWGHWFQIFILVTVTQLAALGLGAMLYGIGTCFLYLGYLPHMAAGVAAPDSTGTWFAYLLGVVCSLVGLVFLPFTMVLVTLFYFDLRVRKEGLDIEWNARVTFSSPPMDGAAQ